MKLKDEFSKTQGKKWLVPWSDKKEIEYQATYIRFLESKIEQLTIPAVVGQSEQLPILDRCECEEPNEEPIKICMHCNGYLE